MLPLLPSRSKGQANAISYVLFLFLPPQITHLVHVYHHASVMALTFFVLEGHASLQWIPITFNLLVHVVMYYYYACASISIRIWWKKHLTTLQITQFAVDLVAILYGSVLMILSYIFILSDAYLLPNL